MRNKILSLVLAVTMLFGTASFAFAADGNAANLDEEILALQAKIEAMEQQIEDLTDKDPTVATLEALRAELAELRWYHAEALEGLELSNMIVKEVKLTIDGRDAKITWMAGPKVQERADKYRVRVYENGKMISTDFVDANLEGNTYEFAIEEVTRGCKLSAFVAPVKVYKEKNYAGIATKTNVEFAKMGKPEFNPVKSGQNVILKTNDLNTTGFQVMVSKNKNFKTYTKKVTYYTNEKALNKSVVTKNFFKKGTNYVKVRAFTKVNGVTYYSYWSKAKTVKR